MLLVNPTRTSATEEAYRRIVRTLERHADRMQARGDIGPIVDHNMRLAVTLYELEPWIAPSTARIYSAALVQEIKHAPTEGADDAMALVKPDESERTIRRSDWLAEQRQRNLTKKRGAQQRATHLPAKDWWTLQDSLQASTSQYGVVAAVWLAATQITGLRPCEWRHAQRIGPSLVVHNAKATNGRSFGPTRTLSLLASTSDDVCLIDTMITLAAAGKSGDFRALYHRVRDLIADVARQCLSKRAKYPTLYTARHLFASAAKLERPKAEVAALMGHGNPETAPQHYEAGRYAKGARGLSVRASELDVQAVQKLEAARAALRQIRRLESGQ